MATKGLMERERIYLGQLRKREFEKEKAQGLEAPPYSVRAVPLP
jgi:hypothetical protein